MCCDMTVAMSMCLKVYSWYSHTGSGQYIALYKYMYVLDSYATCYVHNMYKCAILYCGSGGVWLTDGFVLSHSILDDNPTQPTLTCNLYLSGPSKLSTSSLLIYQC